MASSILSNKIKKDFKNFKNDFLSLFSLPTKITTSQFYIFISLFVLIILCFFLDESVRQYVKTIHNDFLNGFFSLAHKYGKPPLTLYTFLIFYFGGLFLDLDKIRNIGRKILEAFIFSGLLVTIIKSIFGRWRPYTEHGNFSFVFFTFGPNDHLSLPSGDAAVAFAFSVIIAGIFNNKLWKVLWYSIAVLTAFGRIYHDQHWLSDVVLASFISVCIGIYLNKR